MTRMAFGHRMDRWLIKRGDRSGWLLTALKLVTAKRIATAPIAQIANRRAGRRIAAGSGWANYIPRSQGYRRFAPDAFPELPQIVDACQAVYDQHVANLAGSESFNKAFFYNILMADGLRENPVLADFALSAAVTEAVTGYLGHLPRLHSIGVFYSPINDTVGGSQIYHVDGDGLTQIKCFVNIWGVEAGGGGFTFLSKPQTSRSFRSGGLLKTLTDVDVARVVPEERQIVAKGPPGSGLFVDTSRCLHQGSRARERPRLVFQFQYVPRPDTLLERVPGRSESGSHLLVTRRLLEDVHISNPNAAMFVE